MKPKQLRKAQKLINNARRLGAFGPDPDKIFYLLFTHEIELARRIIRRHGIWLISKQRAVYCELVELASIFPPLFNKPDCNGEYWD